MEIAKSQEIILIIVRMIVSGCLVLVFLSIFLDFAMFSRNTSIRKGKNSIVATGTMTLFFVLDMGIHYSRVGMIQNIGTTNIFIIIIIGTLFVLIGCIMNLIGRYYLGSNWANHIRIYEDHTLIIKGPYKLVRHPLYFSIILMLYGGSLIYRNYISFFVISIIFVPFMYYRAKQEEVLLIKEFPDYSKYQRNTGMLFPKIMR